MTLPLDDASAIQRVLVILPTWVGDCVMATPLLRAIRRRFDRATITFLIEPNLRDLLRGGPWMDECLEWPGKPNRRPWLGDRPLAGLRAPLSLVGRLRSRRFDLAVLLPNSFRAAAIARLSGARRRVGYDRDGRGWLLTDRLAPPNLRRLAVQEHTMGGRAPGEATECVQIGGIPDRAGGRFAPFPLVDYYAALAEALGCPRPDDRLELVVTADGEESVDRRLRDWGLGGRRPLVVFGPGARFGAAKCWPADRFAALANGLSDTHAAAVVVACGPGEEPLARSIAAAAHVPVYVADEPRFSLHELKSLVRRADLLVCNDAGLRHFARAFDVPIVTIFGPTHPEWTRTRYANERIVRIDVDCGPCQQRLCPLGHLDCMRGVTVEAVLQACTDMLRRSAGAAHMWQPVPEPASS